MVGSKVIRAGSRPVGIRGASTYARTPRLPRNYGKSNDMKRLIQLFVFAWACVASGACVPDTSCTDTATCQPDPVDAGFDRAVDAAMERSDGELRRALDSSSELGSCGSPTDPKNCGACGHDCNVLANVRPGAPDIACRAGVCVVSATACLAGYGHCSAIADDGCEPTSSTRGPAARVPRPVRARHRYVRWPALVRRVWPRVAQVQLPAEARA